MLAVRYAPAALAICGLTNVSAYAWEEGVCQGVSTVTPPEARSPVPGSRQCGIFFEGKYVDFVIDILDNKKGCVSKKSSQVCLNTNGHLIRLNQYKVKIINAGTKTEMCAVDLEHPMLFQNVFSSDCKTRRK